MTHPHKISALPDPTRPGKFAACVDGLVIRVGHPSEAAALEDARRHVEMLDGHGTGKNGTLAIGDRVRMTPAGHANRCSASDGPTEGIVVGFPSDMGRPLVRVRGGRHTGNYFRGSWEKTTDMPF